MKDSIESEESEIYLGSIVVKSRGEERVFDLFLDMKNKLLYFVLENSEEPTMCISIDTLSPEPIEYTELFIKEVAEIFIKEEEVN